MLPNAFQIYIGIVLERILIIVYENQYYKLPRKVVCLPESNKTQVLLSSIRPFLYKIARQIVMYNNEYSTKYFESVLLLLSSCCGS